MHRHLLILSLIFPVIIACSEPGETKLHDVSTYIINGSVDTDPVNDAVPFVYSSDGWACGGTLIAPNVVLTAGHCVCPQNTSYPSAASKFSVYFCRDMTNCNATTRSRNVIQVYLHPNYNHTNTSYDLALLRLDGPAPADVTPIPHLPSNLVISSTDIGSPVKFIGFGLTNGYDENSSSDVRRIFTGYIEGVCSTSSGCSTGWGMYNIAPYTFYTDQDDGGTCQGDSGGPGLIVKNGTTYVGGITSYGFSNCTGPGVYTNVGQFASQIQSFIDNPPAENCTDGKDNDGNLMTDCADPACANNSACSELACSYGNFLSCNKTVYGNTEQGVAKFSNYSCLSSGSESGTEIAYYLSIPPGAVASFTLSDLEQDLDMFLVQGASNTCSTDQCLDASINNELANETLSFTMGETQTWLVIESYQYPGPYKLTVQCDMPPENCSNGIDDDGDLKVDCMDTDCAAEEHCQNYDPETNCSDNVDNDGDGLIDCADSDCQGEPECVGRFEIFCSDGIDDDEDGLTDCADPDCASDPRCDGTNNNNDDDSDGGCSTGGKNKPSALFFLLTGLAILIRKRLIS